MKLLDPYGFDLPDTPKPFICPECGCEGHHITSADCIKALKERVAKLEAK